MGVHTGPSGVQYTLDDEGAENCDVEFVIHRYTESEDDVMIPMKDILFLAEVHRRAIPQRQADDARYMQIMEDGT